LRPDTADWLGVAAYDKVAAVFQRLPAAPFNLVQKGFTPDDPLDIADLSLDHATTPGITGSEDAKQPKLGDN
jgi:hypothetical protein